MKWICATQAAFPCLTLEDTNEILGLPEGLSDCRLSKKDFALCSSSSVGAVLTLSVCVFMLCTRHVFKVRSGEPLKITHKR